MKRRLHKWRAPYGWSYFHWTGLHLSFLHRRIIHSLERQRLNQGSIRIYIADPDPHKSGISDLLADYLTWLSSRINPYAHTLILDRTIRQARRRARLIPRAHALPSFNPSHTRGHSAQQLLLLNADLYGHDWSADITGHLRRHLFPSVADTPGSIIIIHGNIDPSRNPQFAIEFNRASRGYFGPHWQTVHHRQPAALPLSSPTRIPNPPHPLHQPHSTKILIISQSPAHILPPIPFNHFSIPLHLAAAAAA